MRRFIRPRLSVVKQGIVLMCGQNSSSFVAIGDQIGGTMSSRVSLSMWAFLFGGFLVYGLISAGTLELVSLSHASLFEKIVFAVIGGLPAWVNPRASVVVKKVGLR